MADPAALPPLSKATPAKRRALTGQPPARPPVPSGEPSAHRRPRRGFRSPRFLR
jgi:hypothetical protein